MRTAPVQQVDVVEVLGDACADDACLSLRQGRLAAQALGPDRRPCRLAAQTTSSDEAVPGPPLLRVEDAGGDHGVGVALVHMVQRHGPLVGDGVELPWLHRQPPRGPADSRVPHVRWGRPCSHGRARARPWRRAGPHARRQITVWAYELISAILWLEHFFSNSDITVQYYRYPFLASRFPGYS